MSNNNINNRGGRGGYKNYNNAGGRGGYQQYNAGDQLQQQQQQQQQQGYQAYQQYNAQSQQQGYQAYQQYTAQPQQQGYQAYQQYTAQPQQQGYQAHQQYNMGVPQQQAYQGYQQYNAQPQQAVSLNDYNSKQNVPVAAKPKRTLKLVPSAGVKVVGAKSAVKKDEKAPSKKEGEPVKEEKKEQQQQSGEKEVAAATSTNTDKPTETKKDALPDIEKLSVKDQNETETAKGVSSADALIKEQEDEVDEEVVNDMFGGKDHMSLLFMGHVDAGKSTMGGNLLYLTGSVDKRTIEKYEREAKDAGRQGWYLSWVMDTNKEERSDGKTIEVGRAYFETEKRRYTILDAPGHKMYVSEMIGGASQADVGVLVISARKGEYETGFEKGGQTREHALLAKTQGVNKLIVVINKMDDPTVDWSKERYDQCVKNLTNFLKAIGYNVKQDVVFMPVSGFTGAGLKDRVDPKVCPWYTGPSLLEFLDNMKHLDRHINAPFMLPIASKMKDLGTVVEGKIESGHIKKGNSTLLMPNKIPVEILNIFNETEEEVDLALCGEQVRLRLKGVEEDDIQPGFVLTSPKNPIRVVTKFVATIAIVELKSIMSSGFSCIMHVHTAIEEVKITKLLHKVEKGSNRLSKKPPAFAKKGMKVICVIECETPVCVETYQDYQQLGRFTLRDQGSTIAIGKIIKILD